ncbi:MAG: PorV/PorQ family protein [Bacteroidota bacterium]
MKKNIFIIILIFVFSSFMQIQAQLFSGTTKVGTTSAQFLKIGAGARAIAMGGAYSAMGTDVYSIYWNPAGIAQSSNNAEAVFNHANWLADISYDFAAASLNLGDMGFFAASFTSLAVPEDKVRTESHQDGDGRMWDASSIAATLSYSKELTDRFSVGMNLKYIRESIWNSSASSFAVDVGTLYRTPFNDLMISAAIFNFGSAMELDGSDIKFNYDPNNDFTSGPGNIPASYDTDAFALPLMFRFGLAMDVIDTRFIRLSAAVDAIHPNDNSEYLNLGTEFAFDELLFLRAGYKQLLMNNEEGGLTFGAGLKYYFNDNFGIYINYAYADYGRLKNVQFFDVGLLL